MKPISNDELTSLRLSLAKLEERLEGFRNQIKAQIDTCSICKIDIKGLIEEQQRCCAELEAFSRTQNEINNNVQEKLEALISTSKATEGKVDLLEKNKIAVFIKLVFLIFGAIAAILFKLDLLGIK